MLTDEINLQRLLSSCEVKLKKDPIDIWSTLDKRKLATHVKYLHEKAKKTSDSVYATRIQQLENIVSSHFVYENVDKGIQASRLVKKKHLEDLKQYEDSDPDWLVEIKQEEERIKLAEKKKLLEEVEEEEKEEEKIEQEINKAEEKVVNKTKEKNEIRQRNTHKETRNIEHVLQHHRQVQDELTNDLTKMAEQLKLNSLNFGDTLSKDDMILKEAQNAVQNNLSRMKKERTRLDVHYAKSWGTSFMTFGVILFVCIMFMLVFFTIKFLPKA